jgi:hypothetical protein
MVGRLSKETFRLENQKGYVYMGRQINIQTLMKIMGSIKQGTITIKIDEGFITDFRVKREKQEIFGRKFYK